MTMTSRANPVAGPKGDEEMDDVRGGGRTPVDEDGGGMLAFMMIIATEVSHRFGFDGSGWILLRFSDKEFPALGDGAVEWNIGAEERVAIAHRARVYYYNIDES
jgi:hypothetical protein